MLEKQDILSNKETWKNVLALVPEENILFPVDTMYVQYSIKKKTARYEKSQ